MTVRTMLVFVGTVWVLVLIGAGHSDQESTGRVTSAGDGPLQMPVPMSTLPMTSFPTMASLAGMGLPTMAPHHTSTALLSQLPRTTSLVRLPQPPHPPPPPPPPPPPQQQQQVEESPSQSPKMEYLSQ